MHNSLVLIAALGVLVLAVGFGILIVMINRHLTQLQREFADLRAYLLAFLGER